MAEKRAQYQFGSLRFRLLLLTLVAAAAISITAGALASTTPASGTLSPANPVITFTAGPFAVSNPTDPTGDTPPVCTDNTCGQYALTVDIPASDPRAYEVKVSAGWTDTGTPTTTQATESDFDLFIYNPDITGDRVADGGSNSNPEEGVFTAANGMYTVYVVPFDVAPDVVIHGTITLSPVQAPNPIPTPIAPTPPAGTPRFTNYAMPQGLGDKWGEPSIGVNWLTGKVWSYGGLSTYALKVTFDDCVSPARAVWQRADLTLAATPRAYGGDPILYTDPTTGRTLISQLQFGTTTATMDYTDNDGASFQPSQGSGISSGIDHQTIGGGPYHAPAPNGILYPNAIYYCAQSVAEADCALSIDGGRTFGPAIPIYGVNDCGGLHGHVKVAPDGTIYVPNPGCGGSAPFHDDGLAAIIVSEDNGLTWTQRIVPGSSNSDSDPSVGIAKDGTVYVGYVSSTGKMHVAVTRDHGRSFTDDIDVGALAGVKSAEFPAVVAGDGGFNTGRAAVAFYGSADEGDWTAPAFPGVWYLYVATTFDGGHTWTTVSATPGDPVQRGGICGGGTCRNLLDFFDATIDREGRVLVGYDDGCTGPCVQGPPNTFSSKGVIARQSGGRRMFAQYDPRTPSVPLAPALTATKGSAAATVVNLSWSTPDDGGSPIVSYNIYRRTGATGVYTLLTSTAGTSYNDTSVLPNGSYYYRVRAVNSVGEGPFCGDTLAIVPPPAPPTPSACNLPGILAVSDVKSDGTDDDAAPNAPLADARVNIRGLYVGEPYYADGAQKLVFTIQLAPSTTAGAPANTQWFVIWNRLHPDANFDRWYVAMKTDSAGALHFEYGKFGVPTDATAPNPNTNQPVKLGDADGGTYNPATGVLTITISTGKAEGIATGQPLNGLNARTFFNQPDAGLKSTRTAADITTEGSYTLAGNGACRP
ncbi:MAG: fibronectin type III domain-containing protein [Pyrinomonadaceae bacterium]